MSEEILSHVLQPLSIPCPGCVLNYNSYKTGKIINWEVLECKIPRGGLQYESIVEQSNLTSKDSKKITNTENVEIGNIIKDMTPQDREKLLESLQDIEAYFPKEKFPKKKLLRSTSHNSYSGLGKKSKKKNFLKKSLIKKSQKSVSQKKKQKKK